MASERLPDAFLSYTRSDDRHDGGAITEFRNRLASAVRVVTGEPFEIFQDVDDIDVGERWSEKLDEMLAEACFFIPILTPSYFNSAACLDELEKFLKAEERAGRQDLILPIYYIQCPVLEDKELREANRLATAIHQRQRWEWRDLRHYSFRNRKVRLKIEALAVEIAKARRTRVTRPAERFARAAAADDLGASTARAQQGAKTSARASRLVSIRATSREPTSVFPTPTEIGRPEPASPAPVPNETPPTRRTVSTNPGTVFRDIDASWCPQMVVISPGEFLMGSTEAEREWAVDQGVSYEWVQVEHPQHLVRIGYPLALGRYPVTFGEYDHFADATGREKPGDEGWGRDRRPVINVSWKDAKTYVEWLAATAGQAYRLLSEAEWEYAARAGTMTRHRWGDDIASKNAKYGGEVGRSSKVGSYPQNPWGIYDMNGNVWEWGEDCWNENYEGAPDDGSAWTSGDCNLRIIRGGSWKSKREILRAAYRNRHKSSDRENNIGFRVARTLLGQPAVSSAQSTYWGDLAYHDTALFGRVTFNYSNNNGRYSIGRDEFFFDTKWSKASDRSIYLLDDPPSILGVAEAPEVQSYEDIGDPASYDMTSRVRTIQEGEHAILKNRHNRYAVLKVLDIKDRTRSDSVDELTFEFWILADRS